MFPVSKSVDRLTCGEFFSTGDIIITCYIRVDMKPVDLAPSDS